MGKNPVIPSSLSTRTDITFSCLAIGFCDDKSPLRYILGWRAGSWGFHSDNGRLYEDGSSKGAKYSDPYVAGEVIGCGVNFERNIAFYTRAGQVIGKYIP
jgi:hypothetical protein